MESEAAFRDRLAATATTNNADSVSISSTLTSSPPAFRRDVREYFKRHRPFSKARGNIRPSRMAVTEQGSGSTSAGSDISDDVRGVEGKEGVNMAAVRMETGSMVGEARDTLVTSPSTLPAKIYEHIFGPSLVDDQQLESDGAEQKLRCSVGEIASKDIKMTETNQMEASTVISRDVSQASVPYNAEKGKTAVKDHSYEFGIFLNHPTTHSSVAGPSCTTMMGNSTSVPMVTSTTCCSYVNQYICSPRAIESSNVNMQLVGYRHAAQGPQPPCSTSKFDSGVQADPEARSTSKSSLVETHVAEISSALTDVCRGKADEQKTGAGGNNPIKWKGDNDKVTEIQSQAPYGKTSNTDLNSKHEKREISATDKGLPPPRKRSPNSDAFFKVNGKLYQKLGKIGSGGSSEVHKVISADCNIYALKKIRLKGRDYATAFGFCQEILYLNRLKGKSNIIQLIDFEVTDKGLLREVMVGSVSNKDSKVKDDGYIYMVLEYGEIDLAHMLSQKWKEIDSHDQTIDDNWLRFYWQQILLAVNTIHEERIVHSDLKPANFLLVKGSLKLIDFGIAKAIMSDTTNIQRDSQVGTLSYMSPEAFMCNETDVDGNTIKCGRPSDIWSLGCILYQMVYGRTPFAEHKTFWAKFKVITDPNHEIKYPPLPNPYLLDLMKKCLAWDREKRWRIPQLLEHPFLRPPIPLPSCSPSQTCKLFELITKACPKEQEASALHQHLLQLVSSSSQLHIQQANISTSSSSSSANTQCYTFTFCSNN